MEKQETTMRKIIGIARKGVCISLCTLWGPYSRKDGIRISATLDTGHSIRTVNRRLTNAELDAAGDVEALVLEKILETVKAAWEP